ncbi:hypothetical protein [Allomuricauda sp. F6463D]|uniref:hypothetical protein n=1 Tax=Allomuricauda sp. F6463D TaxID=2926409 RepID=UPI001FF196A8|nr:hypothetical protein [Muricauda sp. F6463D]MCK0161810.1 hypothetical protein [Muricauda sp. F6463D]
MIPIIFGSTFYLLSRNLEHGIYLSEETELAFTAMAVTSCILFGDFIFKKKISEITAATPLTEKINKFRIAFVIKLSLIYGPAVVSTFIYHTTHNLAYLLIGGILVLYMIILVPKKEKIAEQLRLRGKEKIIFNQFA